MATGKQYFIYYSEFYEKGIQLNDGEKKLILNLLIDKN